MVGLFIAGETLSVHLTLPVVVEKFGRQWLQFAVGGIVVLEKSKVMVIY